MEKSTSYKEKHVGFVKKRLEYDNNDAQSDSSILLLATALIKSRIYVEDLILIFSSKLLILFI